MHKPLKTMKFDSKAIHISRPRPPKLPPILVKNTTLQRSCPLLSTPPQQSINQL